jgi:acylphosphatase
MCKRVWVSGRVQGVGFRDFTHSAARALEVSGYAKNLADGRVEVLACGEADAVAQLIERLHQGPRWSTVNAVEVEDAECCLTGFRTG